jgi:hypothetical protein
MKDLSRVVLENRLRSHVEAARVLALFVIDAFPDEPEPEPEYRAALGAEDAKMPDG